MNAAESMLHTAHAAGIDVCFANPGTTELPMVAALDQMPGIRAVLGLFEGVCTGAADGYARMARRPALTLLHMGPGLANGLANLHNARRAHSPVVNLVGDHTTWHLSADAPLTCDIASLAQSVSGWTRFSRSAAELPADMEQAIAAASRLPGQVATLIVPHDLQSGSAGPAITGYQPSAALVQSTVTAVDEQAVLRIAAELRQPKSVALLLGGSALLERSLRAAARIAATRPCGLLCECFPARLERGSGLPALEKLPYFPEHIVAALDKYQTLILVGAREPVTFFGYEGQPSRPIPPGMNVEVLSSPDVDAAAALEALAEILGAPASAPPMASSMRPARPASGPLTPKTIAAAIAAVQPESAIIMDEGATTSAAYYAFSASAPRHSFLSLTGGAIGQGLPCATGAAIACPDRPVLALQADGSGLYTLQALWTQAREKLHVVTLVFSNRKYRILEIEMARAGITQPGSQARKLVDLINPSMDWVHLAQGMGVPAVCVETTESLLTALERALAESGPQLIEVVL